MEAYRRDAASKEQLITELKATKKRLLSEVKGLKEEVQQAEQEKRSAELEQQRLLQEVQSVRQQMSSLEEHLQEVQSERDQLDTQLQVHTFFTHTLTHTSWCLPRDPKCVCVPSSLYSLTRISSLQSPRRTRS